MGVAAARLVMNDSTEGAPKAPGSILLPLAGLIGITVARAAGWLQLNDPLTRCLLFIPLFIVFLMRLHRNTVSGNAGLTGVLGSKALTYLGTISFPIFILHGAIGQVRGRNGVFVLSCGPAGGRARVRKMAWGWGVPPPSARARPPHHRPTPLHPPVRSPSPTPTPTPPHPPTPPQAIPPSSPQLPPPTLPPNPTPGVLQEDHRHQAVGLRHGALLLPLLLPHRARRRRRGAAPVRGARAGQGGGVAWEAGEECRRRSAAAVRGAGAATPQPCRWEPHHIAFLARSRSESPQLNPPARRRTRRCRRSAATSPRRSAPRSEHCELRAPRGAALTGPAPRGAGPRGAPAAPQAAARADACVRRCRGGPRRQARAFCRRRRRRQRQRRSRAAAAARPATSGHENPPLELSSPSPRRTVM
jgi:hypothetical protein